LAAEAFGFIFCGQGEEDFPQSSQKSGIFAQEGLEIATGGVGSAQSLDQVLEEVLDTPLLPQSEGSPQDFGPFPVFGVIAFFFQRWARRSISSANRL
jgi:hypothetical protein